MIKLKFCLCIFKDDFESWGKYISVIRSQSIFTLTQLQILLCSHNPCLNYWKQITSPGVNPVTRSTHWWVKWHTVSFHEKNTFLTLFLHYGLDLNLIGLDWMDDLDLFTVLFIFVFNTFLLSSVFWQSEIFHTQLGSVKSLKRTLGAAQRSKPPAKLKKN